MRRFQPRNDARRVIDRAVERRERQKRNYYFLARFYRNQGRPIEREGSSGLAREGFNPLLFRADIGSPDFSRNTESLSSLRAVSSGDLGARIY